MTPDQHRKRHVRDTGKQPIDLNQMLKTKSGSFVGNGFTQSNSQKFVVDGYSEYKERHKLLPAEQGYSNTENSMTRLN